MQEEEDKEEKGMKIERREEGRKRVGWKGEGMCGEWTVLLVCVLSFSHPAAGM